MEPPEENGLPETPGTGPLPPELCRVVGLNQNYTSATGALYHVQVEDLGPQPDRTGRGRSVRRINAVIYANYGEADAHIVHSQDEELEDLRTAECNRLVEQRIQELAADARRVIEDKEQREVMRIKCLIREYYYTKDETTKREFEEANASYPFLFSRAWRELREERQREAAAEPAAEPMAPGPPRPSPAAPTAPPTARQRVAEIEETIRELARDLTRLRERGGADDILLQTCRKLVARAQDTIAGRSGADFGARRLEMTHKSLLTTLKQVRSRLREAR